MLNVLLVDDEVNNLDNLSFILEHDCEGINIVGKALSAKAAREILENNKVEVIFLDVQMPNEDGFDFLQKLGNHPYKIVFITAYNEFAIKAIKANAVDYLLKPINIEELQACIKKIKASFTEENWVQKDQIILEKILEQVSSKKFPKRIALPQLGSICYIEVDQIVSLQADSNYTVIHLSNMQKMVFSKTLKEFEVMLNPEQFTRIHKSYIVNLAHVREYKTADGGMVKMSDGNLWSISRRQLDEFLHKMKV